MNDLPLVSVVMVSWNRKKDVEEGLTKLRESSYLNMEIIVVDNASIDGTPEMIEERFPEVHLIKIPRNIGIEGYNVGFVNSKGKYIMVLDDDSYPEKNAISSLVKEMKNDINLGLIACCIINKDDKKVTHDDYWKGRYTITFWGSGAFVRKDVLEKVGYYSYDFFLYANEADLAIRILNEGYNLKYCDNIIVHHLVSEKGRTSARHIYFGLRNRIWIYIKYYPLLLGLIRFLVTSIRFLKISLREKHFEIFLKGFFHGVFGGIKQFKKRKPMNQRVAKMYGTRGF